MTFLRLHLRNWFRRFSLFLFILIFLYAIGRPVQLWFDGLYSGERAPYLQMLSATAVTLRWQSLDKSHGVVRYGQQAGRLNQIQQETKADEVHEIRLSDLKPATRYFYSVGTVDKAMYQGENFWFKTAPETGKAAPVRFWVTGDQGYPSVIQEQVRDAMLSWVKDNRRSSVSSPLPDFWITTGDNAYQSGSNPQFQAGFFQPYKNILQYTPVWPAYGNHDARRWVFYDLFTFPTQAESGGIASGSEHYYSFDYANIHFVMLDTEKSEYDLDGEMLVWLKKDLQQTKQQWLITVFHHPPYSKGSHDSDNKGDSNGRLIKVRKNILPILEQAGVDVVLSGHSHMYERSALINCHYGFSDTLVPGMIRADSKNSVYNKHLNTLSSYNGTVYSVIGSSSKVDSGPLDHPAMPYSYQEAGSMIFDVNRNKLVANFVNNAGQVIDRFEINKGVKGGVTKHKCE